MWFLLIFLNSDLCVLREARWTGLFFFSVPARSHALYYTILYIYIPHREERSEPDGVHLTVFPI